jgi:hypothetical protein
MAPDTDLHENEPTDNVRRHRLQELLWERGGVFRQFEAIVREGAELGVGIDGIQIRQSPREREDDNVIAILDL